MIRSRYRAGYRAGDRVGVKWFSAAGGYRFGAVVGFWPDRRVVRIMYVRLDDDFPDTTRNFHLNEVELEVTVKARGVVDSLATAGLACICDTARGPAPWTCPRHGTVVSLDADSPLEDD